MPPKPTHPQSTQRRKALLVTSRDVADSNTHLSKVFGGTQKLWMSHAAASSNNSSVASNGTLPSNSNASPSNPPLTLISSDVRPNTHKGSGRPRKCPEPTSGHSGPPPTTLPTPRPAKEDVTLPSPALTNESSPAHSNRHVTPQTEATATVNAVNPNPSFTTPGRDEQRLSPQIAYTLPLASSAAENEGNLTNEAALDAAPSRQVASPSGATFIPAASETQTTKRGRGFSSEGWFEDAAAEHPLKRARMTALTESHIASNESYQHAMGMCSENLQKHIERAGGMLGMVDLEKHRYKCLLEACQNLDGFYLITHQLFCAWTEHTDVVHQLLAPVAAAKVNKAFGIMQRLLLCNEGLGQEHRTHFAHWPRKLEVFDPQMTVSRLYQLHLVQVKEFVKNLADKWDGFLAAIQSRGYPVLANELIHSLCCWSVVMRKILFTVSRRLLGVKDGLSAQVNSLWDQDQGVELEALKGGMLEADIEKHRDNLRQQHKTATAVALRKAQLSDSDSATGSLTPASASDIPRPDSYADGANVTRDILTNLTGRFQGTSNTAATTLTGKHPQAAARMPSLEVATSATEHQEAQYVVGNGQRTRGRQEQQGLAHGAFTVRQDSAQAFLPPRRDNSRESPIGVSNAANSPAAQQQPRTSTQDSGAGPATAFPDDIGEPYNSEFRRVALAPNHPSASRELVLPSQRLHPQALESQPRPVHMAVRYVQPHEAGMQQRGPAYQTATNVGPIWTPQYPGQAQSTQTSSPNFAGQQSPHLTPNQATVSHGQPQHSSTQHPRRMQTASDFNLNAYNIQPPRFASQAQLQRQQQQSRSAMPMTHTALAQQGLPDLSNSYHSGSTPVRQVRPNPQQIVYPLDGNMPAGGRAPHPAQNQRRHEAIPAFVPRAIPDNEAPASPHDWVSAHVAAHLPQLRSPLRKPLPTANGRHFQYVESFCVQPWKVHADYGVKSTGFELSKDDMVRHRKKTLDSSGVEVSPYADGTRRLRLRCCLFAERVSDVDATWAVTPTRWPSEVYISFNGRNLNVPRKQHFRYDMPVELTDLLVTGTNELKLVLPKRSALANGKFWFAIESVAVCSLHTLLNEVCPSKRAIDPRQMEQLIAKRLTPSQDEEVQVAISSGLTISIADPWTSVMFELPVRGLCCEHLECFDLKTYLQTRPCKPTPRKPNQEPSLVDCWKCPICDRDARPCHLGVDMYMLQVRNELVSQGKGNCKAIVAQADGSWSAVEERDDDEDDDMPPSRHGQPTRSSVGRTTEVIEILDD